MYIKRYKNAESEHAYNVTVVNKRNEVEDYISSAHIKSDNNLRNKIGKGAELPIPSKRTRYGEQAPSNSTPVANIAKISESASVDGKNYYRSKETSVMEERGRMAARVEELAERIELEYCQSNPL